MGMVFDKETARQYAAWARGPQGRAMDRWLETCLPLLLAVHRGERVLDIGCGEGSHLLLLKELGLDISGVDASPYMINRARERLGRRCTLKTGAAEDLPFEDNAFDLSVMIHTLEFIEDPLEALREAGRVTRRAVFVGGMNSVSWSGLRRRMRRMVRSLAPGRLPVLQSLGAQGDHAVRPRSRARDVALVPGGSRADRTALRGPFPAGRIERPLPFGAYVGLVATIIYRVRTDNQPVKVPVRPGGTIRAQRGDHGTDGGRRRGPAS